MKSRVILYIVLLAITNSLYGQDLQNDQDSLFIIVKQNQLNNYSSSFAKQLSTFTLTNKLDFLFNHENFFVEVNENFNSTFLKTADKSIRDDQQLRLKTGMNLTSAIDFGLMGKSLLLSDSRRIDINSTSVTEIQLFSTYKSGDFLIRPSIGYQKNRQVGETDHGNVLGLESVLESYHLYDLDLYAFLKLNDENISRRKNFNRDIRATVTNKFNDYVNNSIAFQLTQVRKDFYFLADSITNSEFNVKNNIQSRIETNYILRDKLNYYGVLKNLDFYLVTTFFWRSIDRDTRYKSLSINSPSIFDTRVEELKFDIETNFIFRSELLELGLKTSYSERDEKHLTKIFEGANPVFFEQRINSESQKNNFTNRVFLSFFSSFNLSNKDKVSLNFFHNKLRYDTPSLWNIDDRDELLSILRINYTRILNPFFSGFINIEGNLNRMVYLSSKRSSNNYLNRVLKLNTGGLYSGSRITSYNSFEVTANYTVYDYEELNPNYKSFSFRQYSFSDSTVIHLSNRIKLKFSGYVKFAEQGEFRWSSFSMKPTRYLEEKLFLPQLVLVYNHFSFTSGLRFFSLKTFNYEKETKVIDSYYSSSGPLSEIKYSIQDHVELNITGWYEFIKYKNEQKSNSTNLFIDINWFF